MFSPAPYFMKLYARFYRAGAVSPETAVAPGKIGVKENLFFKRAVQFGFLLKYQDNYYLSLQRLKSRPLAYRRIVR